MLTAQPVNDPLFNSYATVPIKFPIDYSEVSALGGEGCWWDWGEILGLLNVIEMQSKWETFVFEQSFRRCKSLFGI